jgi:hypothetical protein
MGALQVVTQYPLQSKAFTSPLSARYVLSRIFYSALYTHVTAAPSPTTVGDVKTIISHYKTSKHLPCDPYGYWLAGHLLFSLNTQKTAANDKLNFAAGESNQFMVQHWFVANDNFYKRSA